METIKKLYKLSEEVVKFLKEEGIQKQGWNQYKNDSGQNTFYVYFDGDTTALKVDEYPNQIEFNHYSLKIQFNFHSTESDFEKAFVKLQYDFEELKNSNLAALKEEAESKKKDRILELRAELELLTK